MAIQKEIKKQLPREWQNLITDIETMTYGEMHLTFANGKPIKAEVVRESRKYNADRPEAGCPQINAL